MPPEPPPRDCEIAVEAWNIMGGLNWVALPIVCELLGIEDVELLIYQLVEIRKLKGKSNGEGHSNNGSF